MLREINTNKLKMNYFIEGINFTISKVAVNSCLDHENPKFDHTNLFSTGTFGCWHSEVKPEFPIIIDVLFNYELNFSEILFYVQPPHRIEKLFMTGRQN